MHKPKRSTHPGASDSEPHHEGGGHPVRVQLHPHVANLETALVARDPSKQVLLVAPPRLHALRQQAQAMQQQRGLPPEQRPPLGLKPSQYCLAGLLPSQLRTARFCWVGYRQPAGAAAAEQAAVQAEWAVRRSEPQAGGTAAGIEVPICVVPSLLTLRGPGYPWSPSEGPEVAEQGEEDSYDSASEEEEEGRGGRSAQQVAFVPQRQMGGKLGRRPSQGQVPLPGEDLTLIDGQSSDRDRANLPHGRSAEEPGSPTLSALLSEEGSDVLLPHDDALSLGAVEHPLLLPEAHPVLLSRPIQETPLGAADSAAKHRFCQGHHDQQYSTAEWQLPEDSNDLHMGSSELGGILFQMGSPAITPQCARQQQQQLRSPSSGPFTPWTRHLNLPAGLSQSQSQQQQQQQQPGAHQSRVQGNGRQPPPQMPPSWTPRQQQQPPSRPSWGIALTAAHPPQLHPPLASRLVEDRTDRLRLQEQQQQQQLQGSVGAGALFTAVACPPPPAEASTVPWSEAEARGDRALGEALRLACSIHAVHAAAAVAAEGAEGGPGEGQVLSADELRWQMAAVLPFLAARQLKPQAMELSRVAEAALKAASSAAGTAAAEIYKQAAAASHTAAAPALVLPSSMALSAPHAALLPLAVLPASDNQVCEVCGSPYGESTMILCDMCDKGWHCSCLQPPLRAVPEGTWTCPDCPNPEQRRPAVGRPSNQAVAPRGLLMGSSILDQTRAMRDAWGRSLAAAVLEEEAGPPPQILGPFDQGGHQPAVKRTRFFWGGPGDGGTSSDEDGQLALGGGGGGAGGGVARAMMGAGSGLTSQQLRSRIVGLLDEEPQHNRAFHTAGAFSGNGMSGFGPGPGQPCSNTAMMMPSAYGGAHAAGLQPQQFLLQRQAPPAGPTFQGALRGAQGRASMSLNAHPAGRPSAAPGPGGKASGPLRKRRMGGAPLGGGAKAKRRGGVKDRVGVGEEEEFPDETETEAEDNVELHDDDDEDSDFVVGGNQLGQAPGGGRGGGGDRSATGGRSKRQLLPAGNGLVPTA